MEKVVKEKMEEVRKKWNDSIGVTDVQKIKEVTGLSIKEAREIAKLIGIDNERNKSNT